MTKKRTGKGKVVRKKVRVKAHTRRVNGKRVRVPAHERIIEKVVYPVMAYGLAYSVLGMAQTQANKK
jgi:hypothetical protein